MEHDDFEEWVFNLENVPVFRNTLKDSDHDGHPFSHCPFCEGEITTAVCFSLNKREIIWCCECTKFYAIPAGKKFRPNNEVKAYKNRGV